MWSRYASAFAVALVLLIGTRCRHYCHLLVSDFTVSQFAISLLCVLGPLCCYTSRV
ncbi:uncharacterized protein HD556DRAFT_1384894 [Suillus plorans]|uniref:Uncharacterized protein n=1 Tax=Suillus plorans TaxID=116603 RepID=A0A9P7AMG0_9AGAM|nr:uncharacterized protein HD556DRAFT_1416410 [Suillus plorans]XP_041158329.1 uncharacterized protein HD556DRAFT_1384894 [Suillus plorans]KAG1786333.1 hypothetical protein HD556DRAFT_1416410 [Suillus plorans]KAG1791523.1 hypothetical protein HD556DRAFT_1384894 [Suillus plorans]